MLQKFLTNRAVIIILLILQPIPLLLMPAATYNLKNQEWWLAALLVTLSLVAVIQILRSSTAVGPWDLIGFSHGFNIISRLLMLFPHITIIIEKQQEFNTPYAVMTIISIAFSWFILWFVEKPEVRLVMLRKTA